jgi:hypothetical protein
MTAWVSDCGKYRYHLERGEDPRVAWVMLNPSTADAELDDPTLRKCMGFTKDWGYGGVALGNVYAYRTPLPDVLFKAECDIVGPHNHVALAALAEAPLRVVAWGRHARPDDVARVMHALGTKRPVWCLGVNQDGSPKHPLYVPYAARLIEWRG